MSTKLGRWASRLTGSNTTNSSSDYYSDLDREELELEIEELENEKHSLEDRLYDVESRLEEVRYQLDHLEEDLPEEGHKDNVTDLGRWARNMQS